MEEFKDAFNFVVWKLSKYVSTSIRIAIGESIYANTCALYISYGNIKREFYYKYWDYIDIYCISKKSLYHDVWADIGSFVNLIEGVY